MNVPLFVTITNLLLSQITISEVMFDLDGADSPNEFIEIYNFSDEDILIQNWQIVDNHSTDELAPDGFDILPAGRFAIILEGDYDGFYDEDFPDDILIIYVDDRSIGNGLGNNADSLLLINELGNIISEMGWNSGMLSGYSLEKIVMDYEHTENNWRHSLDSLRTPGKPNSVISFTVDVAVDSIYVTPENIAPDQEFDFIIQLINRGILNATSELWLNSESAGDIEVFPGEMQKMTIPKSGNSSGSYSFFIQAVTSEDYNSSNDTSTFVVHIHYKFGDVLINEIMYEPEADEAEWVELINQTDSEINLDSWKILDKDDWEPPDSMFSSTLKAGDYAVISDEPDNEYLFQSDFPSLNNSGDDIYLFDPTGKMIDHLRFENSWGGSNGFSLERITYFMDSNNAQNWGTCIDQTGSTPNLENSIYVAALHQEGTISVSPNPFSPDGDGIEDETIILYQLPFSNAYLRMIVYDSAGREIAALTDGSVFINEGTIRWNGKTNRDYTCRMGQYLLYVEAADRQTGQSWKTIERIIVAKK